MKKILIILSGLLSILILVIAVFIMFIELEKRKQTMVVQEKEDWELLLQHEEDVCYSVSENAYFKQDMDGTDCYIVSFSDQIERPKEIKYSFSSYKKHLVLKLKEDGSLISYEELSAGEYIDEISEEIGYMIFNVYTEDEYFILYGTKDYKPKETKISQKRFSVLGDSVSAYSGYIPSGYISYYSRNNFNVQSMWWAVVAKETGMIPCVINACGGSGVTELNTAADIPTAGNSERSSMLSQAGKDPDIIIIMIGGNDILQGVKADVFKESYLEMLNRIKNKYEDAEIYICSSYQVPEGYAQSIEYLNELIHEIANDADVPMIDVEECDISTDEPELYFEDYNSQYKSALHVNQTGQEMLGEYIAQYLLNMD